MSLVLCHTAQGVASEPDGVKHEWIRGKQALWQKLNLIDPRCAHMKVACEAHV